MEAYGPRLETFLRVLEVEEAKVRGVGTGGNGGGGAIAAYAKELGGQNVDD